MLTTQNELLNLLSDISISYANHEHPAVFTVEEADRHKDGIEGAHCKNLFLKDKKQNLFLVVTLSDKPINLKALAKTIGAKNPSFAKPELLKEVLGVAPGSVTPFAAININNHDVTIILDEDVMANRLVNFHPLVNTATTTITPEDLLRFMAYCNQSPRVLRL